jgi:hypothetical protein
MRTFNKIRTEIKTLSEQQTVLKPQRKTVYFTGERTMDSSSAAYKVIDNRNKLRHLFEAYAILKGKDRQVHTKVEISESLVNKYVEQYTENMES